MVFIDDDINKYRQVRREKIGVVVFVFAIIGIVAAAFGYMQIGHYLDLAASNIDSNVGQLDGYLTVVFEGHNTQLSKKEEFSDKVLSNVSDFLGIENINTNKDNDNRDEENEQSNKNIKIENATISNVGNFYIDKSSSLFVIQTNDYEIYKNGQIFECDNWKLGVISINQETLNEVLASKTPTTSLKKIQENIYKMRYEQEVNLVFIICPSQKIIDYIDKVDSVICQNVNDDVLETGKLVGSTFVMRDPTNGSIGAITSSPAKMLMARTYKKVEVAQN